VELLVSIGIAAAVTVGITSLLNSDFQANATVQRYLRLRRQVSLPRRFIDREATMASRLQLNGSNSFELFGVAGATPTPFAPRWLPLPTLISLASLLGALLFCAAPDLPMTRTVFSLPPKPIKPVWCWMVWLVQMA